MKEPSEPFMVKNTEPSSENKSKPNTISYESFVLQKEIKQTESYFKNINYRLSSKDSNQSSLKIIIKVKEKSELLQS